jgi:hypothetical protein
MWRSNSWENLSSLYIGIRDFHIILAYEGYATNLLSNLSTH